MTNPNSVLIDIENNSTTQEAIETIDSGDAIGRGHYIGIDKNTLKRYINSSTYGLDGDTKISVISAIACIGIINYANEKNATDSILDNTRAKGNQYLSWHISNIIAKLSSYDNIKAAGPNVFRKTVACTSAAAGAYYVGKYTAMATPYALFIAAGTVAAAKVGASICFSKLGDYTANNCLSCFCGDGADSQFQSDRERVNNICRFSENLYAKLVDDAAVNRQPTSEPKYRYLALKNEGRFFIPMVSLDTIRAGVECDAIILKELEKTVPSHVLVAYDAIDGSRREDRYYQNYA